MRGAKDEEKMISPMFPRVHVNDTDKGGPRAPPRNKMALYEQLSIPSQRFNSGSSSTLPLPPNNGRSLVPSVSPNHGGSFERIHFNPFGNSLPKKRLPFSLSGVKSMISSQEQKSTDQGLNVPQPLLSTPKGNSFQSQYFSSIKNFSCKRPGDESDFRVPSSAQAGAALHHSKSQQIKDCEKQQQLSLGSSMQLQSASDEQKEGSGNLLTKKIAQNQAQDKEKVYQAFQDPAERSTTVSLIRTKTIAQNQTQDNEQACQTFQDPAEKSKSVSSIRNKRPVDASFSLSTKVRSTESLKRVHPSSNQQYQSNSSDVSKSLHDAKARSNQSIVARQDVKVPKENIFVDLSPGIINETASRVRIESYSRPSHRNDDRISGNGYSEENDCGSLPARDVERYDDASQLLVVDSISASGVSPDDVVRAIGEKQFWKARRAIVNQQRVFALQVFELHRLIKVQKLIAGSPNVLLEGNLYLRKTSFDGSPSKKLPSAHPNKELLIAAQPQDHSPEPHSGIEFTRKITVGKLPFAPVHDDNGKGLTSLQSKNGSNNESALLAPVCGNSKQSPWDFRSLGNQWLVPVMSPSEGLVYKPYTGPCPPPGGFMAPMYGSCSPMNLIPHGGDIFSTAYSIPASRQGMGVPPGCTARDQTYFPSFGTPVMYLSFSGSAVEQMSPLSGPMPKDIQFLVGDPPSPNQSSCSMQSQTTVLSNGIGKFPLSKKTERQGSTANSPLEMASGDVLPLFPVEPEVQPSDQNDQSGKRPTCAIKVVPRNRRSATESAARIFLSIQDERKKI